MGERELFLAALELRDPREIAVYLERACAVDAALRARVEALLKSHEEAGSFLEAPATYDVDSPIDQPLFSDSNIGASPDALAQRPGPLVQPNEVRLEVTGAHTAGPSAGAGAAPVLADSSRDWTTNPGDLDLSADGPVAKSGLPSGATVRYFGDYEIQKELGRGGMGVVYKARQVTLNRPVALKMIKAGVLANAAELRRFQNEAEAVALLDHSGIIPVYEVGDHDGQRYFSMKLIDGGNLGEQLASFQDDPKVAVSLMIEIAEAIQHAHMRGILHRDLKPANILIDAKGHPHITDFGLAKRVGADVEMTASGAIMGTPAYMSPEQTAGRRGTITTATDVYGLGAIFYALLTGKAPFGGESLIETLDAVRTRPPESPTKLNPKVPRDLELICLKCLEKDPVDRYSAGSLAADLGRFAMGEPVSVRAAGVVERVAKWARRKPTLAAAYALGLLTLLLGGIGSVAVWQWRDAATARETLARVEYGRTIQVALQAWRENNVPAALDLLDSTRPDLRGWEWRYVHRLCHSDLFTLKGDVDPPLVSPDGSRIAIVGRDGTAKVWDTRTGAEVYTLKGHTYPIWRLEFSRDGTRIVTTYFDDHSAKLWDAKTGAEVHTFNGHRGEFSWTKFSSDVSRIVTWGDDGTPKVRDARTGAERSTLRRHTGHVISPFSPDGSRIVTASQDGTAIVWDAKTGTEVRKLKGHTGAVRTASFSPDGSRIVTASHDKTAIVWDAGTDTQPITLKGHTGAVSTASFSPDGSQVLTVSDADRTAKMWDSRIGSELFALKGGALIGLHGSNNRASFSPDSSWASFSPDGSRIVTAGYEDRTAKVWDARNGTEIVTLKGHTEVVRLVKFSPDGSRIVTASDDQTVRVWDGENRAEVLTRAAQTAIDRPIDPRELDVNKFDATSRFSWVEFSPDGSRFVTANGIDKDDVMLAKVWSAQNCAQLLSLKGHTDRIMSASFSPDGSRIVTASNDGTAKVWDAQTGAEVLSLKGHSRITWSASFSPDGSRIVTASFDGTAKVWDATPISREFLATDTPRLRGRRSDSMAIPRNGDRGP